MRTFRNLLQAEFVKAMGSRALRLVGWLVLGFLVVDYTFFASTAAKAQAITTAGAQWQGLAPIKAVGAIWAGFFHPMMLALVPSLVFLLEHRAKAWKHLHAMPVSPRMLFLAKVAMSFGLVLLALLGVFVGLGAEWTVISLANHTHGTFSFPWMEMVRVLGWLLLGSLPLLALYCWISMRVSSGLVSVLFGIIGLVLNITLSGRELDPSWKRDLIPWVLPYASAQQAIDQAEARQETHLAGVPFNQEIDLKKYTGTTVTYLPSGRKVTTTTTISDYYLQPPPPTPRWLLASFSLAAFLALMGVGLGDARRGRQIT